MSKIPQGEWNAIAARYQGGESISKIARSYSCTPPAIHYILKRNRQKPTELAEQPQAIKPAEITQTQLVRMSAPEPLFPRTESGDKANNEPASAATVSSSTETQPGSASANVGPKLENGPSGPALLRQSNPAPTAINAPGRYSNGVPRPAQLRPSAPEPIKNPQFSGRLVGDAPPATPMPSVPKRSDVNGAASSHPRVAVAAPGLDSDLHTRAETAIALFRSSFDAALAEGSLEVRERLRQAATDLMRVAARTTMVLDRLNASNERSARTHNYPRSALAGEDIK
jgi:Meckel syndrome type 1 protein